MRFSASHTTLAALLSVIVATDAFTVFPRGSRTFLSKSAVPLFDSKESMPGKINGVNGSQEAVFPVEESTEKMGAVSIVDESIPVPSNVIETEEEKVEENNEIEVSGSEKEKAENVAPETTVESEETVKEPTLEEPKSEDAAHVTVVESSVEEPKEELEPPVVEESEAPANVQEAVVEEPEVEATKLEEPKQSETIEAVEEAKNEPSIVEVDSEPTFFDNLVDDLKARFHIFQESQAAGFDFKQSVANVLAGQYDGEVVREEINDIIKSNPCVMFTWEQSPACKKAVEAFGIVGAEVKNVRLDDPWSEGNPIRAEIGKMVGKSSVPMIFIGGEYVGGHDAGVSEEAPGIVAMAFKGTLRPKLQAAGALKEDTAEVEQ